MYNWFAVFITIVVAFVLTLLPMPEWATWGRPAWVLLVLIYWAMMTPQQVGIGMAWFVGVILDLMTGTLLGEHALAFTIVIYFVNKMNIRLRIYPLLQQGMSIFFFVFLYLFILYCVQGFLGELPSSQLYWLSAATSMLLWPWLFVLMRDFRRWFGMA